MKRITFISAISTIAGICFVIIVLSGDDCNWCFSVSGFMTKFIFCGLVIIIGSIYFRMKFLKTESIIFDIESQPMLETNEATDGVPFAGQGITKEEENILTSPYTKTPCVYFHSIKEKLVQSGKNSHWEEVENVSSSVPFYIQDKEGKLKIDIANMDDDFSAYKIVPNKNNVPNPKNSEIDCQAIMKHYNYKEGGKGFFATLSAQSYRKSEFILQPGIKIFAYGIVSRKNGELVLHENEKCPLIISKKSRKKYVQEFYKGKNLVYLSHLLVAAGFTTTLVSLNYFLHLKNIYLLPILFAGNFIITGSVIVSLYNRIVALKQRALNALSNIEVEMQRRKDLIPALVNVVKGYSGHENEIQQILAESRQKLFFSKELPEEKNKILPSLVAAIENYPDLEASDNFQSLMRSLVDTEERIAYSREFYNRSVRKYNTLINQFPFVIVSWLFKIKEMGFVSIGKEAKNKNQKSNRN